MYTHARVIRGDGNDVYRAVAFSLLESAVTAHDPKPVQRLMERCVVFAVVPSRCRVCVRVCV